MQNDNRHEFLRDRARACLLAGAMGDALGAAVEFDSWSEIQRKYGPAGIQQYDVAYGVRGAITDDTQMTLFSAEGLIRAWVRQQLKGVCYPPGVVAYAYQRWLLTQGEEPHKFAMEAPGWLIGERGLHQRRAPGNTCLAGLREWKSTRHAATNNSKGCGTVMRSAPFGFYPAVEEVAGKSSDLTHGHVEARTSAIALAQIVQELVYEESTILAAVEATLRLIDAETLTAKALVRACELSASDASALDAITELGEGWVAEEALAVAVFCALRAQDDLIAGLRMAVNHSGDSDSTGSICGNIIGAAFGMAVLPETWLRDLELRDVIDQVAQDLVDVKFGSADDFWKRYPGG
ncbi:MAG: ADP-ribosylglycohydrolase family protein [Chthonomonas sp.]|nr:ADP-ribosylglycohydrolase family protein [Chthonomonas sp.]